MLISRLRPEGTSLSGSRFSKEPSSKNWSEHLSLRLKLTFASWVHKQYPSLKPVGFMLNIGVVPQRPSPLDCRRRKKFAFKKYVSKLFANTVQTL